MRLASCRVDLGDSELWPGWAEVWPRAWPGIRLDACAWVLTTLGPGVLGVGGAGEAWPAVEARVDGVEADVAGAVAPVPGSTRL